MPLDELLAKYHTTGAHGDDDDDGLFLYSPASLSDDSDASDGNFVTHNVWSNSCSHSDSEVLLSLYASVSFSSVKLYQNLLSSCTKVAYRQPL